VSVSSTLHTWDFDDVTDLSPPIGVDEAFALARPNLARDAEGGFVFGVNYEGPGAPSSMGNVGAVRFMAWIWRFSSTARTAARRGTGEEGIRR
jgi:hypothetical protein